MSIFCLIVLTKVYESFTHPLSYLLVCGTLSLPYLLYPFFTSSPYASKAILYLTIYSFIGNYFYTHYFYTILKAQYTFIGVRFNNVPIGMYFATVFYFTSYHAFSNCVLRFFDVSYEEGRMKKILFGCVVFTLSYFTAFMESFSISSFPYYNFSDRSMVYTLGSLFYGIYFLFSFPMFYYFDKDVDKKNGRRVTVWETVVESCGCGMLILIGLDFVRVLVVKVPFVMEL
ncbi:hypothetical protein TrLO_g496 [Triparma laevis f. longispina]|uniref:Cycloeucalenol cycloisomerase n=1 Tax=Triparma laevis f. longispina TaxID=1714387 RepID=A0A9W7C8E4_9STRA|nr:hypothetical protein TrLO_g496 [Triparma laevis f. longispina]